MQCTWRFRPNPGTSVTNKLALTPSQEKISICCKYYTISPATPFVMLWYIFLISGFSVNIRFTDFSLEPSTLCSFDFVRISTNSTRYSEFSSCVNNVPIPFTAFHWECYLINLTLFSLYWRQSLSRKYHLRRYCGSTPPPNTTTQADLDVTFKSDVSVTRRGFTGRYIFVTGQYLNFTFSRPYYSSFSTSLLKSMPQTLWCHYTVIFKMASLHCDAIMLPITKLNSFQQSLVF